jgi:hypothetical protein
MHLRDVGAAPQDSCVLYTSSLRPKKKSKKKKEMHLRAVGAAPQDSSVLYNYALFLETKRKDYASADDFYQVK